MLYRTASPEYSANEVVSNGMIGNGMIGMIGMA
jgi:hypothetical protein